MSKVKVEAIVDGGMIGGNPGKGGWGGRFQVIEDELVVLTSCMFGGSFGEELVTNNVCEWRAIIGALQIFIEYYHDYSYEYEIISDSKLIINQAKGKWGCKDQRLSRLRDVFLGLKSKLPLGGCNLRLTHKTREHTIVAHDHIAKILGRS